MSKMDFTIEELTMNAWPSLQTLLYDGWIIRMAGGYTKRANSINPIYSCENKCRANPVNSNSSSNIKLQEKIKKCEELYRLNNLPIIFKIIDCDEYKLLDRKLEDLNYEKLDLTSVQVCKKIKPTKIHEEITTEVQITEDWKRCFYSCYNISNMETMGIIDKMLKNIRHPIICVLYIDNGQYAGCGYGVVESGYVGLFDIIVKEEFRGKGIGKKLVETILAQSKERGADKAYLAVVNNNIIAKKLYQKIGFIEIYKYWYRKKE